MADHIFAIITEPPSAAETEAFERWYVDRHIPDVLAVPGMVRARRYRLAGETVRWMTIYEMTTDDRAAVMAEIARRAGTDAMPLFPGTRGTHLSYLGEAVTGEMRAG